MIELKQPLIITYDRIKEVSTQVQERIAELNLENLIVSDETVSAVKKTKAELNKEFKEFEDIRKVLKNEALKPYNDFEEKYKEFVAKHYNEADDILKRKIGHFEVQLKKDKENEVKAYFTEVCQSKGIDFIPISKLGLKITLSASLKSLKEQINIFIEARKRELDTLNSIPESDGYKNAVLFEYKKTLDMSSSHRLVQERQKALKEAQARAEAKRLEEAKKQEVNNQEPKTDSPKPLTAPVVEEKEEQKFNLQFEVRGTKEQLKALKQFIIDNHDQNRLCIKSLSTVFRNVYCY